MITHTEEVPAGVVIRVKSAILRPFMQVSRYRLYARARK